MKTASLVQLAWQHAGARRSEGWVAAAGLGLGVFILTFTCALGLGARRWVLNEVIRAMPVDMVEVLPKTLDLGFLRLPSDGLMGGRPLDASTLAVLAAMPGVAAAYPKLDVSLPLGAQGGNHIFGRSLYTDLFVTALPEALVRDSACPDFVDPWSRQAQSPGQVFPVVISAQLIELYNTTVAQALHTPQLTAQTLVGFEFDLVVGRSIMLGSHGARRQGTQRARIVGVSAFAAHLGATIPLGAARWLMAEYAASPVAAAEERYGSIMLRAKTPQDIVAMTDGVTALGLKIDTQAQHIRDLLWIATALMATVGFLVLALAGSQTAFNLYVYVTGRRRQLAILQVLGLRRADVVLLVMLQAIGLGLLGGFCGITLAFTFARSCDALMHYLWPQVPYLPSTLFDFSPRLLLGCFFAAVGAASLGAVGPARQAFRRTPKSDLAG